MMHNAGHGLADLLLDMFSDEDAEHEVVGLAGPGNNGGDTLVAMTALAERGWKSRGYLVKRKMDELVKTFVEAGGKILQAIPLLKNLLKRLKQPMSCSMTFSARASDSH